jgi:hypothetical protein
LGSSCINLVGCSLSGLANLKILILWCCFARLLYVGFQV